MKRVGIIGAGGIGVWHASRWKQLPVDLVGFYDIDPQAMESACQEFGGKAYPTLDALLADVDIVDVCSITPAHKEAVLAAAEAKKAIVCEKPLARHVSDCEEMIAACEENDVPLFVAQVVRFFPQFAKTKAVIDSGQVGKPCVVRTVRAGSHPGNGKRSWFGEVDKSGGVIMDVGLHDIDFLRWSIGEVERVFARGMTFDDVKGRDHALISLRFTNGAIGHVECSWSHPQGIFCTAIEVAGDGGMIEWDSLKDQPYSSIMLQNEAANTASGDSTSSIPHAGGKPSIDHASPLFPEDDPYYLELKHFLDCIENGTSCKVSPHDGLMAVKVSLAAMESMRCGQPVDVATFEEVKS